MKTIKNIVEYIISLLLILDCNSVFRLATDNDYHINEILVVFFGIYLIITLIELKQSKKKVKSITVFVVIFLIFCVVLLYFVAIAI